MNKFLPLALLPLLALGAYAADKPKPGAAAKQAAVKDMFVTVKPNWQAQTYPVRVLPMTTVKTIKTILAKVDYKLSADKLSLSFAGTTLQDDKTLDFYGIKNGSVIDASKSK